MRGGQSSALPFPFFASASAFCRRDRLADRPMMHSQTDRQTDQTDHMQTRTRTHKGASRPLIRRRRLFFFQAAATDKIMDVVSNSCLFWQMRPPFKNISGSMPRVLPSSVCRQCYDLI